MTKLKSHESLSGNPWDPFDTLDLRATYSENVTGGLGVHPNKNFVFVHTNALLARLFRSNLITKTMKCPTWSKNEKYRQD